MKKIFQRKNQNLNQNPDSHEAKGRPSFLEFLKKRKKIWISTVASAAAAVVVVAVIVGNTGKSASATTTVTKSAKAQTGDISTTISSTGTLAADSGSSLELPVGIKIKKVLVSSGDTVKKGQKIATVYKSSVANVLLTINENIDDIENAIDDLDYSDTSSDDYLQYLVYNQELKDAEKLQSRLKTMLTTGYIKATRAGIISDINISNNTEITSSDSSSQESSSSTSESSSSTSSSGSGSTTATNTSSSGTITATALTASTDANDTDADAIITMKNLSSFKISTPKSGSQMQSKISSTKYYSGSIVWKTNGKKTTGKFESGKTYTAEITLQAADGYQFSTEDDYYDSISLGDATLVKVSSDGKKMTIQTAWTIASDSATSSDGTSSGSSSSTKQSNASSSKSSASSSGSTSSSSDTDTSSSESSSVQSSSTSSSSSSTSSDSSSDDSTVSLTTVDTTDAVTIASSKKMVVSVSVDESDINSVKVGQTAEVTVSALSDTDSYDGKITDVSSSSTSSSDSSVKYTVEITIDKEDGMLEGMSASCVITVEEADDTILIPSAAISESGGQTYVYTSKESDGTLSGKTTVSTGLSNGSQVQITSGLEEGDTVYYQITTSDSSSSDSDTSQKGNGDMSQMPNSSSQSGAPSGGPSGSSGNGGQS